MQLPLSKNTFYVLDLDRCLADTDKLFMLLEKIIYQKTAITESTLKAARTETEQTGGSFDVISYLEEYFSLASQLEKVAELEGQFVEEGKKQDLFEPGARDLLAFLSDSSLPFGILTFGGKIWQRMKLQAMGLDVTPYIITDTKAKGKIIASWKQADGVFVIPPELYKGEKDFNTILLIDDKFLSFEGLPEGAYGIHVLAKNLQVDSLSNVVQVHGMTEAEALIKSSISI